MSDNSDSDSCSSLQLSDDEEKEVTWTEAQQFKLRFGKYKGTSLERMVTVPKRRAYLRYLMKWDELRPYTKNNIAAALKYYDDEKRKRAEESKKKSKK